MADVEDLGRQWTDVPLNGFVRLLLREVWAVPLYGL